MGKAVAVAAVGSLAAAAVAMAAGEQPPIPPAFVHENPETKGDKEEPGDKGKDVKDEQGPKDDKDDNPGDGFNPQDLLTELANQKTEIESLKKKLTEATTKIQESQKDVQSLTQAQA